MENSNKDEPDLDEENIKRVRGEVNLTRKVSKKYLHLIFMI